MLRKMVTHPRITRLLHWEYWPFWAVYLPMLPWWLLETLRCRSVGFFAAANPGIPYGGLMGESKKDIHAGLPAHLYPPTLHFDPGTDPADVARQINISGMDFPLIGKPDMGGKGRGVMRLHTTEDLHQYASGAVMPYHVQPFVPFDKEVGIFYHRFPGNDQGEVTGVVGKEFMTVTGDGRSAIGQLLAADRRGAIYVNMLRKSLGKSFDDVLVTGEVRQVAFIGNHARGARFIDLSDRISSDLNRRMDELARQIPGFYFGRFDIRYQDWGSFLRGDNFCVIEVNGAGSEPTHMYDPAHGISFAWREIRRHWEIMGKISRSNHTNGHAYLKYKDCLHMLLLDRKATALLKRMPL